MSLVLVGSLLINGLKFGDETPTGAAATTSASHDAGTGSGALVEANPEAPEYVLRDPAAPARAEGEVHEIELVMTERAMTVATGFEQLVWTFGDEVPGPVMRVKVGDVIRITLKNPETNAMPHSIDFHSSMVDDEMRSINPGEDLIYEFEAKYAGVYMYHCGTSPALMHIANGMIGMIGMIIVEPADGLPPVDHEFALVQSEWYIGQQARPSTSRRPRPALRRPTSSSGTASPTSTPIIRSRFRWGWTVRVFVLNAGPSIDSSFHVVGTIFHSVIKKGIHLAESNEGNWGSQAVDLSPAQGAIVEMRFDEAGLYPIVTHAFHFVGRGALGLFQAGSSRGTASPATSTHRCWSATSMASPSASAAPHMDLVGGAEVREPPTPRTRLKAVSRRRVAISRGMGMNGT